MAMLGKLPLLVQNILAYLLLMVPYTAFLVFCVDQGVWLALGTVAASALFIATCKLASVITYEVRFRSRLRHYRDVLNSFNPGHDQYDVVLSAVTCLFFDFWVRGRLTFPEKFVLSHLYLTRGATLLEIKQNWIYIQESLISWGTDPKTLKPPELLEPAIKTLRESGLIQVTSRGTLLSVNRLFLGL